MAGLWQLLAILLLRASTLKAQSNNCFTNKADIVFLLDSSTSEGTANFQKQLDFVSNFTNDYDIGPDNLQVSIITFSTSYTNNFYLNANSDKPSLLTAINNVPFIGGNTYTHAALAFARENSFLSQHGGRQGVPKVMVVMTDGQSTNPFKTEDEGKLLRATDIKVISIGIGSGISLDEIRKIATDNQHAFTVPSFDSLQSIRQEIQTAACFTVATPAPIVLTTTTTSPTTTMQPCDNKTADIVFVLDASGSEGRANFDKQLQFVVNFTDRVDVGPNNVQISVVTFSNRVHNAFYLNTYTNKADVKRGIYNATYVGSTTNTDLALRFARENSFKPENGGRGNSVIELIIVLTDGNSQSPTATKSEASKIHGLGIKVISVGIGDSVSQTELADIATDSRNVFSVKDFDALSSIESQIQSAACGEPVVCGPEPTDIVFIIDTSTSEGTADFRKQLDFMAAFVQEFDVGPGAVQFGLVTSTREAYNEFYLNSYHDKAALIAAIHAVRFRSGTNAIARGLLFTRFYQFTAQRGARPNAKKIAIVLSNGGTLYLDTALQEATTLKNTGVTVISIGIGEDINPYETTSIATDKHHTFMVGSFDILHTLLEDIKEETCANKPTPTPSPVCGHKMADIVFVLDSSSSETSTDYHKQLDMVRDFVYQFQIGPQDIQVSIVTFSRDAHELFPLDRYHDRTSLERGIANVGFSTSGYTNTDKALQYVRRYSFLPNKGGRPNASRIVILLTDGESRNPTQTTVEAQTLKNGVDAVVAIGIGIRPNHTELLNIASDPIHAFIVPDFDALQSLTSELTYVTCNTCSFLNKADIVFLLDASSREGAVNFQKQLDFTARVVNDLTIGQHGVQIGVVTFANQPQLEFHLNQYSNKAEVLSAIQRIHYMSGDTHTDTALRYAQNNMFTSAHGDRTDATDYVIVLTDGASADRYSTLQQANDLKQNHVTIIAVGIGPFIDQAELQGMASDANHEFEVGSFDALRTIREDIKRAACTEVTSAVLTSTPPSTSSTSVRTVTTKTTAASVTAYTTPDTSATTTDLQFGCRSENQLVADPNDCTRYYRCVIGDIQHETCAGGNQYYFNPATSQCDLKQNVPSCQP